MDQVFTSILRNSAFTEPDPLGESINTAMSEKNPGNLMSLLPFKTSIARGKDHGLLTALCMSVNGDLSLKDWSGIPMTLLKVSKRPARAPGTMFGFKQRSVVA